MPVVPEKSELIGVTTFPFDENACVYMVQTNILKNSRILFLNREFLIHPPGLSFKTLQSRSR